MAEITPMMSQYLSIKERHRDAVLFFRLGDFYEMFNEDAVEVSRLLNLTLTQRNGHPMCGIPYHASRVYIARLIRAGKKIAVCEQGPVPAAGKGIAERKVVEVITPGTVVDEEYLDKDRNNYLASLTVTRSRAAETCAFAFIDVSTGEFSVTSFPRERAGELLRKELGRIAPTEILVQQSLLEDDASLEAILAEYPDLLLNKFPDWQCGGDGAYARLCALFGTESLSAFSVDRDSPVLPAAGLLIDYLSRTSGPLLSHVKSIDVYGDGEFVILDDSTRKNLELERNLRDATSTFTLLEILDETRTSMGSRLLRKWVFSPLVDEASIKDRVSLVSCLYRDQRLLARLRETLSTVLDIERIAARVAMERAHGKDLIALRQSLSSAIGLSSIISESGAPGGLLPRGDIDAIVSLRDTLASSLLDDCPIVISEGGMIRPGWSAKLDELRDLKENSSAVLSAYLEEERERTGIQNLRIRYTRMIGYYLEVSKGRLDAVPDHFIKRRSLANGDRFTTDRLIELETELNGAEASIVECERELFIGVRASVASRLDELSLLAHRIARLDVLQSLAHAATVRGWVCPEFSSSGVMDIQDGRHPVVEAHLPSGSFVPNSLCLSSAGNDGSVSFALITGPNMAGKSTLLRQTALIHVMAQIGSFVPASRACLTPVDRIFCRVGASDNLARGESTFLVEMTETAHILRSATKQSLVIMDEVGRGTSTEDGLSLASAILECLVNDIGAKTLFATHYHELSSLSFPNMRNYCLDVLESEGEVVFLKRLKEGASANSYGIHVARLAGLPRSVLSRAEELLASFAARRADPAFHSRGPCPSADAPAASPLPESIPEGAPSRLPGLFSEEELVIDEILSTDTERLTPLEALTAIDRWKRRLFPSR